MVAVLLVVVVFLLGFLLFCQAIVGGEIRSEGEAFSPFGMEGKSRRAPDRNRVRNGVGGAGLMVAAVLLGAVIL